MVFQSLMNPVKDTIKWYIRSSVKSGWNFLPALQTAPRLPMRKANSIFINLSIQDIISSPLRKDS